MTAPPRRRASTWTPLVAVCLGTLMLLVDVTIVNVALPDIVGDLSATFADLQWVIDIYALVLAALLLAAGSLADAWGRRRVYVGGLAIFTIASLVCGLAQNPTQLIVARGVQGVGGAAMFATTVALLNVSYVGRQRGVAYGIWGAVSGASAGLGVVLGGVLVQWTSWRWIFLANLPVAVTAIVLSFLAFRSEPRQRVRLDLPGMATFVAAAGSLTYSMIRAGERGWGDVQTELALGASALSFVLFIIIESRTSTPLVDLQLFRHPRFVGLNLASGALAFTAFGYFALMSIWLQTVQGMSPLQAGLAFLPLTVTAFVVSGATGGVLNALPPRWPIAGGMLTVGAGAACMMLLDVGGSWLALVPGMVLVGIGVGVMSPAVAAAALGSVSLDRAGMASGVINTARQLGLAFGVALLGAVFQSRVVTTLDSAGAPQSGATARGMASGGTQSIIAAIPSNIRSEAAHTIDAAFVDGLDRVFLVAGAVGIAIGVLCLIMLGVRPTGSSHRAKKQVGDAEPARVYVGRHRGAPVAVASADAGESRSTATDGPSNLGRPRSRTSPRAAQARTVVLRGHGGQSVPAAGIVPFNR